MRYIKVALLTVASSFLDGYVLGQELKLQFYILDDGKCKRIEKPEVFDNDYCYKSTDSVLVRGKRYSILSLPYGDGPVSKEGLRSYVRFSKDSVIYFSDVLDGQKQKEQLFFIASPDKIGSKWSIDDFYASGHVSITIILRSIEYINDDYIYRFSVIDYKSYISWEPFELLEFSYSTKLKNFTSFCYWINSEKRLLLVPKNTLITGCGCKNRTKKEF